MRFTALELACLAQLWVSRVADRGVVRREDTRIVVGPDASADVIATVSCRRLLELRGGRFTESDVRAEVKRYGFRYRVAPAGVAQATQLRDRSRSTLRSA